MKKLFPKVLSILQKPLFLYLINPFVIFFIGVVLTLFLNPFSRFTTLIYPPSKADTIQYPKGELLANHKIVGEFVARDNNLGIVLVRFDNFQRISSDSVRFGIKEKGSSTWFYQNDYRVDQFQPNKFFTFGFPVIPDSANKTYQFQVESLHGRHNNAIGRSEIEPFFMTTYQFPRYQIFSNPKRFIDYIIAKRVESTIENKETLIEGLYYFLPISCYLFIVFFLDLICKKRPMLAIGTVLVITFIDIVIIHGYSSGNLLIIGLLWGITFLRKRISGGLLVLIGVFFTILIPFASLAGLDVVADKITRWFYTLLLLGFLLKIIENRYPARITYKNIRF